MEPVRPLAAASLAIALLAALARAAIQAKEWLVEALAWLKDAGSIAGHPLGAFAPELCFYVLAIFLVFTTIVLRSVEDLKSGVDGLSAEAVSRVTVDYVRSTTMLFFLTCSLLMVGCIAASACESYWKA